MSDSEGSIRRTLAITVRAAVVNNPPVFSNDRYMFSLSENANDNDEIGLIVVTDDGGIKTKSLKFEKLVL